jgi:hypothetical protein
MHQASGKGNLTGKRSGRLFVPVKAAAVVDVAVVHLLSSSQEQTKEGKSQQKPLLSCGFKESSLARSLQLVCSNCVGVWLAQSICK